MVTPSRLQPLSASRMGEGIFDIRVIALARFAGEGTGEGSVLTATLGFQRMN